MKKFRQEPLEIPDCEVIEGRPRLYVTPAGKFPSITSVLSALKKDDDGLDKWRKRVGDEEADKITKAASDRGDKLHDYAEKYLLNTLERSEMSGAARLLFNRARQYYDQIDAVYATECVLYSDKLKVAGRADAIVHYKKPTVLDHKNSRKMMKMDKSYARRKLFTYMLQATGYSMCFYDMFKTEINQGMIIVANYTESNARRHVFDITDYFRLQFELAVDIYYGRADPQQSDYYKL
jgi:hypothetical protein